jgi:hypothetical protein
MSRYVLCLGAAALSLRVVNKLRIKFVNQTEAGKICG